MKKFLIFAAVCFLSFSMPVFAASPSPATSPTSEEVINEIDQLKDKVASKVAELKLVEKRGIMGTVTDSTDTQITLTDLQGNTRFIDVDELTKFNSSDNSSLGISDVKKDMTLGVLGLYNKESRRLLARFIDVLDLPQMLTGAIIARDEDNFTLTFATEDEKQYLVNIENVTKTYEYGADGTLTKSGFSKASVGTNTIVVGFLDTKEKNTVTGSTVILFPGVPKNPKIVATPEPSPTASPSASLKPSSK